MKREKDVCAWLVHTYKPKYEMHWIMSKVEDHSRVLSNMLPKDRNLTSSFITNVMYGKIVEKKDMEVKHIMLAIE